MSVNFLKPFKMFSITFQTNLLYTCGEWSKPNYRLFKTVIHKVCHGFIFKKNVLVYFRTDPNL